MTVARLWGMPVLLSPGLAGLVAIGAVVAVWQPEARTTGLLIAAAVLLSLLAHEVAHGLAARHFGYDVDAVELTMWGGRTAWSGDATPDAHTALTIAAAGPATSAAIAVVGALANSRTLAITNLVVALVNLVPVTGSDGWVIWEAATSSAPEPGSRRGARRTTAAPATTPAARARAPWRRRDR